MKRRAITWHRRNGKNWFYGLNKTGRKLNPGEFVELNREQLRADHNRMMASSLKTQ